MQPPPCDPQFVSLAVPTGTICNPGLRRTTRHRQQQMLTDLLSGNPHTLQPSRHEPCEPSPVAPRLVLCLDL